MKFKKLMESSPQFIKFCIVGVFNTLISVIVFNILTYLGVNYLIATVIGYLAGLINGYISSSRYVFKKDAKSDTAIKFIMVYLSALAINLIFMYIMVDIGRIHPSVGQIIVTGFNVVYNFMLNKMWTFKGE